MFQGRRSSQFIKGLTNLGKEILQSKIWPVDSLLLSQYIYYFIAVLHHLGASINDLLSFECISKFIAMFESNPFFQAISAKHIQKCSLQPGIGVACLYLRHCLYRGLCSYTQRVDAMSA